MSNVPFAWCTRNQFGSIISITYLLHKLSYSAAPWIIYRVRVVAVSINDGHGPPPNLILSPNCIKDKREVLLGSHILAFSFMKDDSFFYSC